MSEATVLKMKTTLDPIDAEGLSNLAAKGKANPANVVTLKAKTVCEKRFRNLTYVRNLEAHVIDEPPHLLGDDTAPNPSEAVLATLGSCLSVGLHANAVAQGIRITSYNVCYTKLLRRPRSRRGDRRRRPDPCRCKRRWCRTD